METEADKFLGKAIDLTRLDGFHIYAILVKMEQFGVWVKSKQETSFIAFNNIKDIRLDRRSKESDF